MTTVAVHCRLWVGCGPTLPDRRAAVGCVPDLHEGLFRTVPTHENCEQTC